MYLLSTNKYIPGLIYMSFPTWARLPFWGPFLRPITIKNTTISWDDVRALVLSLVAISLCQGCESGRTSAFLSVIRVSGCHFTRKILCWCWLFPVFLGLGTFRFLLFFALFAGGRLSPGHIGSSNFPALPAVFFFFLPPFSLLMLAFPPWFRFLFSLLELFFNEFFDFWVFQPKEKMFTDCIS